MKWFHNLTTRKLPFPYHTRYYQKALVVQWTLHKLHIMKPKQASAHNPQHIINLAYGIIKLNIIKKIYTQYQAIKSHRTYIFRPPYIFTHGRDNTIFFNIFFRWHCSVVYERFAADTFHECNEIINTRDECMAERRNGAVNFHFLRLRTVFFHPILFPRMPFIHVRIFFRGQSANFRSRG